MATLGQRDFSLGWIPSDSEFNARTNGLLRMDNLTLDERGAVTQARGTQKITTGNPSDPIIRIYSEVINNTKHRFIALRTGAGDLITRGTGTVSSFSDLITDTGTLGVGAFSSALGQVIATSGASKWKYDGTNKRPLGIEIPSAAPTVALSAIKSVNVHGTFAIPPYTGLVYDPSFTPIVFGTSGVRFRADPNANHSLVIQTTQNIDGSAVGGIPGNISDADKFVYRFIGLSPVFNNIQTVTIEFFLVTPPSSAEQTASDSYRIQFNRSETPGFSDAQGVWSQIEATRGDFSRIGTNASLNWKDIKGVRVTFTSEGAGTLTITSGSMIFYGGASQLNGEYEYIQVNVYDNGKYIAKSPISSIGSKITAINQTTQVTPVTPSGFGATPQTVNQIWIYRRKPSVDSNFYVVAIRTNTSQFEDTVTDVQAASATWTGAPLDNIADLFLIHPPNNIIDISDMFLDRLVYITTDAIYISHRQNPDSVDSRYTMKASGESTEINLWIKKVSDSQLLLGTTQDIYELAGTGVSQEDGTIDFILRPLSVSNPPISRAKCTYNGSLFYLSNEGWIKLAGSTIENISGNLKNLFDGRTSHGIGPILLLPNNQVNFDCTVAHQKLWTVATISASTRYVYVYDFVYKYWYLYEHNPISLFTEADGTLLGGYGGSDNHLRQLDIGTLQDGTLKQEFHFRSGFIDNNEPDRRKDVNVFRVYANSSGDPVTVTIRKEDGSGTTFPNVIFNGNEVKTFSGQGVDLGKAFQLEIASSTSIGCTKFTLYYWALDYEPRPKSLNYINVLPQNFGIAGRKRFYDLPFVFAAFGNNFTVTPVLDNVNLASIQFLGNPTEKKIYTLTFNSEVIGHELGIKIRMDNSTHAGEFYELLNPRTIEPLPDLQRFHRIPYTNLGSSSRKRFQQLALIIDTRGNNVTFTPLLDNTSFAPVTINTTRKQTFIYTFPSEAVGVDIGGTLQSTGAFEFYGPDPQNSVFEELPPLAKYLKGSTDFGTAARKRFSRISFVADPRGGTIRFTPILDGVGQSPTTYSASRRTTFSHYFTTDQIFVDLDYEIQTTTNTEFEFYKILQPEILDILPEPVKFYHIPRNNLGVNSRKRFIAYSFIIDTKGQNVTFTPTVDGVSLATSTVNTVGKTTYTHFFTTDVTGVDIGGLLSGSTEFEFYGVNFDETISEKLPPRARRLFIPVSNFGIASKKRVRTIPIILDPRGNSVTFIPTVDGVAKPSSVFSGTGKGTRLHFFEEDIFGTDFSGELSSSGEFEFYGMDRPESVEVLPVPKKWDQFGPFEFDRHAWLRLFRFRMITEGALIVYRIFMEDVEVDNGTFTTTPNVEKVYEVSLTKGINGKIFRMEIESTSLYYKISGELRYGETGAATQLKKLKLFEREIK